MRFHVQKAKKSVDFKTKLLTRDDESIGVTSGFNIDYHIPKQETKENASIIIENANKKMI